MGRICVFRIETISCNFQLLQDIGEQPLHLADDSNKSFVDALQFLVLYLNFPIVLLSLRRPDVFLGYNEEAIIQVVVQLYQQRNLLECLFGKIELVLIQKVIGVKRFVYNESIAYRVQDSSSINLFSISYNGKQEADTATCKITLQK